MAINDTFLSQSRTGNYLRFRRPVIVEIWIGRFLITINELIKGQVILKGQKWIWKVEGHMNFLYWF